MYIYFADNIKLLRKREGLSQTELADKLGLTRNMVASYERKLAEPKIEMLLSMASFFGVSLESLLSSDLENSEILKYEKMQRRTELPEEIKHVSEILHNFETRNHQVSKMLDGFRNFYNARIRGGQADAIDMEIMNQENLLYIIESIVNVNQSTAKDLKKHISV